MNVQDIFEVPVGRTVLPEAEEVQLIEAAQAGDEAAKETLVMVYAHAIKTAIIRFGRGLPGRFGPGGDWSLAGGHSFEIDDVRSTALMAFLEVIETHNPALNPRLAGRVEQRITARLAEQFTITAAFTVPERTLSRFHGILRKADGDLAVGEELAPSYEMSADTFRAVAASIRHTGSLEGETESWAYDSDGQRTMDGARLDGKASNPTVPITAAPTDPYGDAEDAELVRVAFTAVDDTEDRVVRLAYGFRSTEDFAYGEPVPDAAIAERMGWSRPKVQRTRAKALAKMRDRLGVA